ncbi:hypothetical protein NPIL_657631 [Nephila pilipes]|uniref:Uncharacterized protein n=1 Tax=Nephila pilipes TaxID=299642 RepID=A0A8X6NTY1_NEPPI|nr:hypothetical protein NPIL_657631 [Nephila pilipes]
MLPVPLGEKLSRSAYDLYDYSLVVVASGAGVSSIGILPPFRFLPALLILLVSFVRFVFHDISAILLLLQLKWDFAILMQIRQDWKLDELAAIKVLLPQNVLDSVDEVELFIKGATKIMVYKIFGLRGQYQTESDIVSTTTESLKATGLLWDKQNDSLFCGCVA